MAPMAASPKIRRISTCTVRATATAPPPPSRCELAPWDLAMLSVHYIQKGHLFSIPSVSSNLQQIVDRLKTSLSTALVHFYPLTGRLSTVSSDKDGLFTHIDCNNTGAEFTLAAADNTSVADVVEPIDDDVHSFVKDFFPYDLAVNHDGHTIPLLAVQLTALVDGVFLGISFNHAVGDGTSFWKFFNAWAEICRGEGVSRPPVHNRWFMDGRITPPIRLPFNGPDEFIERVALPELRERIFHFSLDSIARLKERANKEKGDTERTISSFQALSALVWRSITKARGFPLTQSTSCRLAIENRARLNPPLSPDYFGNSIYALRAATTVGELLEHDLGWVAAILNKAIASHNDAVIRGSVEGWMAAPVVYKLSGFDRLSIMMGSSPRFDMYGCDFGWGKAVALRSGSANKFDGKVSSYPGREGGGSVDLEICLPPKTMSALESDVEFMSYVSSPPLLPPHGLDLNGTE